jgi:hypothetical protein
MASAPAPSDEDAPRRNLKPRFTPIKHPTPETVKPDLGICRAIIIFDSLEGNTGKTSLFILALYL